ncbi:MAG: MBL fold metallo-hydrolase [Cytophagaceae bacterium]
MINIQTFTFNPFQENTYLLFDETKEAIIIDPGCSDRDEEEQIKSFITNNGLVLTKLINTHCHVDHVLGNYFIKDHYKVPLIIHKYDEPVLKSVKVYAPSYGFYNYQEAIPDHYIEEGQIIQFGNSKLEILFVPGHAPGHIALYNREQNFCISGDVLFYRSIGRTDLPGGNFDILIQSIHRKLFKLPDNLIIYPGHGPETTIGEEKLYNPFCAIG